MDIQSGKPIHRSTPAITRQIAMIDSTKMTRFSLGGRLAKRAMRTRWRSSRIYEPDLADKGQVAIALGVVNAIAHHKFVWNFKA